MRCGGLNRWLEAELGGYFMGFSVFALVLAVEHEVDAMAAKAVVACPACEGFAVALELGFDLV